MTVEIEGIDKLGKGLSAVSRQLPFTIMRTLNDLAFDSQKALNADIKHSMNVRANTSKAYAVDKATKASQIAIIRMKDDWHREALEHHYRGGSAEQIATEKIFIRRGYMTDSNSAIPVKKMGKAAYRKVIAGTRKTSGSKMFVVPVNNKSKRTAHLEPGVYQRLKRKIKPLMIFTDEAQYKKRLDMNKTVDKVVKRRANKYFFKHLENAMRTAR